MTREHPNSPDAEICLISCCFTDRDVLSRCIVGGIRPDSFYEQKRAAIFGVMIDLYLAQKPCEPYVVAEELARRREFESIGGMPYLAEITGRYVTSAQAEYFIETVRQKATLRRVIREAVGAIERCHQVTTDFNQAMAEVGEAVTRAAASGSETAEPTMQQVAKELHAELLLPPAQRKAQAPGVSWGLVDLDRTCGMLMPGALVVLAGMPSSGKSALADQVAWNTAGKLGLTTLIFTYEMSKRDKAIRIAQQQSRLNYDQYDAGMPDRQSEFVKATKAVMDCKNLHVFERDVNANRLIARVRAFASRGKVGLIVVDFLQYLSRLEPTIGKERTDEKLGRLTAAAKQIAGECGCPILLLSSLNRSAYADGERPTMAGLKNSGEIESDTDQLGILHWPKQDPAGTEQDPHDSMQSRFYVEFNQEKGRNKGVATVGLTFDRKCTRFDNYSR